MELRQRRRLNLEVQLKNYFILSRYERIKKSHSYHIIHIEWEAESRKEEKLWEVRRRIKLFCCFFLFKEGQKTNNENGMISF